MVSVFEYTDFRAYLQDAYGELKKNTQHVSYRFLARKVGFRSPGYMTQLLQGKCNLSQRLLHGFVSFLKLTRREAEYFELMVHFCQAKTQEEKQHLLERLGSFREVAGQIISPEQYELYSKWYYVAIRDILSFYPFRGNYRQLAKLVEPTITVQEAKTAISLLSRLGLVKPLADGRYVPTDAVIRARSPGYDVALARYALIMMERAHDVVDRLPKEQRNISWVGFSVSDETFARMQEEIAQFRTRLLKLAKQDANPSRAYHLNLQLFPVSKAYPDEVSS